MSSTDPGAGCRSFTRVPIPERRVQARPIDRVSFRRQDSAEVGNQLADLAATVARFGSEEIENFAGAVAIFERYGGVR